MDLTYSECEVIKKVAARLRKSEHYVEEEDEDLEPRLQDLGFDMSQVKTQRRCHTKRLVVDSRSATGTCVPDHRAPHGWRERGAHQASWRCVS